MPTESDLLRVVQVCIEHHPDPTDALEAACIAVGLPSRSEMERRRAKVEPTLDFQVFPDDFPEVKTYLILVDLVTSLTEFSRVERRPEAPQPIEAPPIRQRKATPLL